MTINDWQREVYALAKLKGFHDDPLNTPRISAMLMNVVTELAEAQEHLRDGNHGLPLYEPWFNRAAPDKPDGFAIELADAMIRLLDVAETLGIDMEATMHVKHEYNKTRPHKHGGKIL